LRLLMQHVLGPVHAGVHPFDPLVTSLRRCTNK
jgi:hypothetical protein